MGCQSPDNGWFVDSVMVTIGVRIGKTFNFGRKEVAVLNFEHRDWPLKWGRMLLFVQIKLSFLMQLWLLRKRIDGRERLYVLESINGSVE